MRPLPEKWHGLTDVEQRYRQRYLDLVATPGVRETFVKRARIVSTIRRFLDGRVPRGGDADAAQAGGGGRRCGEAVRDAPQRARPRPQAPHRDGAAPQAARGGRVRSVYEIGRIFRNEGIDRRHNPEFTSIEFYEAYATAEDLMRLTEGFFTRSPSR